MQTKLTSTPSMLERLRESILQPSLPERILISAVGQQLCAATRHEEKTTQETTRDADPAGAMTQLRRGDIADQD
jgi:hypothetical protein